MPKYASIKAFLQNQKDSLTIVLLSAIVYVFFAFYLVRENFTLLILLYSLLFALFLASKKHWQNHFNFWLAAGVLLRLVFLFATPNLSQDFYRFIWDGQLILKGINPYVYTPNQLMANAIEIPQAALLHQNMGVLSAQHYSNYPPVNQLLFAFSCLLGGKSILGCTIAMRSLIILADVGVAQVSKKLLPVTKKAPFAIFWYYLNPLIIIEFTGNLHFEGIMLLLLVLAIYLIAKNKVYLGAVFYASSILIKLIPLLFLPFFIPYFKLKKAILFYTAIMVTMAVCLAPFISPQFASNYSSTLSLWFSNFEFNASIYNVVKTIAVQFFEFKPWQIIKLYGNFIAPTTIIIVLLLWWRYRPKNLNILFKVMVILLTVYYFLATTVHPWYLAFLLGLSIFTAYRFTILWSATIILSYYAYSQPNFKENLGILSIAYLPVYFYFFYEIFKKTNIMAFIRKNK